MLRHEAVVHSLGRMSLNILICLSERPGEIVAEKELRIVHGRVPLLRRRNCGSTWRSFGRRLVNVNSVADISQTLKGPIRPSVLSSISKSTKV
jgi:hypothetical protein